ncbi:MAG: hypothetical protein ABGX27_07230 [Desulfurobacteriaceae bacterium]
MIIDFVISSVPIFILFWVGSSSSNTASGNADDPLKKASVGFVTSFLIFMYFVFLVTGILFKLGDWLTGLFTTTFEEKIIFWRLTEHIDVSVVILAFVVYIVWKNIKKGFEIKKFLAMLLVIPIFFFLGVAFFLSAVYNAKDLKAYYTVGKEAFYEPCTFQGLVIKHGGRGSGTRFYAKCGEKEEVYLSTSFFAKVICKTGKDKVGSYLRCNKLKGKKVFLIRSLYSNTVYGLKLAELE